MGRSGSGGGGSRGGGFSSGRRTSGGFSGGHRGSAGSRGTGGRSRSRTGGSGIGGFGGSGGSSGSRSSGGSRGSVNVPIPIPVGSIGRAVSSGLSGVSGGGSGGYRGGGSGGTGCLGGTFKLVVAIVLLAVAVSVFGSCASGGIDLLGSAGSSSIAASTVEREPIPASATIETGYYTDADGSWVDNAAQLQSGLRAFYKKTGVQPYVYILPNGQETSVDALTQLAEGYYGELFQDEGHFILVFCDDGQGAFNCGYSMGGQARTVMDDEALSILAGYLNLYYDDLSLDEEQIFSKAFEDTGTRIMTVKGATLRAVLDVLATIAKVVGGVIVVVIAGVVIFIVVKKRSDRLEAEAKRQHELLTTPLEKFGDTEVEELARKYADRPGQTNGEAPSQSDDGLPHDQIPPVAGGAH